jgi:hypothetical protein
MKPQASYMIQKIKEENGNFFGTNIFSKRHINLKSIYGRMGALRTNMQAIPEAHGQKKKCF